MSSRLQNPWHVEISESPDYTLSLVLFSAPWQRQLLVYALDGFLMTPQPLFSVGRQETGLPQTISTVPLELYRQVI